MSPWLMTMVVMFSLSIMKPGSAQSNTSTSADHNTLVRSFCDRVDPMSPSVFFSNLNNTFASLRGQLSREGVYFARAQSLGDADSVYSTAQCRRYLSATRCVACFDMGVSAVAPCTSGNGAYVTLDDCFLRYQNFGDYYNDPTIIEDVGVTAAGICSHQPISDPIFSNQFVEEFLTDIRVATPKTSNFYVSSTRKGSSSKLALIAAITAGVVLFLLILALLLWYRLRTRSKKVREDASELLGAVNYNYKDIQKATQNFSTDYKIGKGGFAEVYKAWKLYESNMHLRLIDPTLNLTESEVEHVRKIIEIGLTCTQSPANSRPTMSEVVLMLSNERSLVQRTFGVSQDIKIDGVQPKYNPEP
ncbi:hypothetical protein QVD17_05113 [Tagetes erecta]|uniref:Gnk2-homologous domain-containing protein n=1 Tax=Tagetes erecta TaxID=13708 RepID=A0AAD8LD72_TARER|nr:hypothetical protein QVD17_05113 [Tagetes erecta]